MPDELWVLAKSLIPGLPLILRVVEPPSFAPIRQFIRLSTVDLKALIRVVSDWLVTRDDGLWYSAPFATMERWSAIALCGVAVNGLRLTI